MANTRIQVKRSSVTGRTPNVSDPSNTSYIAAGEFALNMADNLLYTSNGVSAIIVGAAQKNLSADSLAANSVTIANGISVGNSTVNASINATSLFAGNGAVNTVVNTTYISVSNTISNSSLSPRTIFVGNSTVNTLIDTTGGVTNFIISAITIDATAKCTIQTAVNHGLSKIINSTVKVNSNLNTVNNSNYAFNRNGWTILDTPTANTITFTIDLGNYGTSAPGYRSIKTVSRTNGIATIETNGSHGFANQTSIFIPKFTSTKGATKFSFATTSATANVINSTAFSYPNQSADTTLSLTGKSYSVAAITAPTAASIYLTITYSSHGLSAGQLVTLSGVTPASLKLGSQTISLNGNYPVASINGTTSFTLNIGFHPNGSAAVTTSTGTFSAGTVKLSYNEGPYSGGIYDCYIGQLLTSNTSYTSNISVNNPVGISINNGNTLVRVTDTLIYVGNTLIGTIFDQNGPRQVKV